MADGLQDQQQHRLAQDDDEEKITNSESDLSAPVADTELAVSFGCLGAIPLVLVGSGFL